MPAAWRALSTYCRPPPGWHPNHGVAPPTWRVCSIEGGTVALQNGINIHTSRLPRRCTSDSSVWVVPGLGLDKPTSIQARITMDDACSAIAALRKHARAGGAVARWRRHAPAFFYCRPLACSRANVRPLLGGLRLSSNGSNPTATLMRIVWSATTVW